MNCWSAETKTSFAVEHRAVVALAASAIPRLALAQRARATSVKAVRRVEADPAADQLAGRTEARPDAPRDV
jgi:hypothetical protein